MPLLCKIHLEENLFFFFQCPSVISRTSAANCNKVSRRYGRDGRSRKKAVHRWGGNVATTRRLIPRSVFDDVRGTKSIATIEPVEHERQKERRSRTMRRIKAGERGEERRARNRSGETTATEAARPKPLGSAEGEGDTFSIITFADAGRDKSSRYIAR